MRAGAGFRDIAIEWFIVISLCLLLRSGFWARLYKSSNE